MNPEREPSVEIDHRLLAAYARTFIARFDRYSVQLPDGRYRAVQTPLTLAQVEGHVRGSLTLGVYALDAASRAQWVCYDADDAAGWQGLLDLAHDLAQVDAVAYRETSRRGGHLWLFFDPLPGRDARRLARQLIAGRGLEGVEIYPKQDALRTGPGSLVRLPLGIHRKTGRRYPFVDGAGELLAPTLYGQLALLAQPRRLPAGWVDTLLRAAPEAEPLSPTPSFAGRRSEVAEATLSERIKNRISVYEFVSQYVPLDRGGRGLCPFHDDHAASFAVHLEGNYWHCFAGCGGGSVIDFWMRWRQLHGQDSRFTATITALAHMLL